MIIKPGFETEMTDLVVESGFRTSKWDIGFGGSVCTVGPVKDGVMYFGACDRYIYALRAKDGKQVWRFKTGNWVGDAKVIVVDGVVYIGSVDGSFYSLDSRTGRLLWKFRTGGDIWSDSVFFEGLLIFGSWDCHVYAVDSVTGKEAWRFQTSTKQQAPLDITDEVIAEPEFREENKDYIEEERKYESPTQINVSGSEYTPAIEYQVKDVYRAGKKKYDSI